MPESSATEPLIRIGHDGVSITILGTAHVSRNSADTVTSLIATGRYDGVALELCENRLNALTDPDAISRMDIMQVVRKGKGPMVMASLALGAFQKRIADQLDIEVGADMRAGAESAEAHNLPLMLIDRDVGITMKRIYRNVPWFKRVKVLAGLLASVIARRSVSAEEVERLKRGDMLESTFNQFAEHSAEIYKPLVDERDQYMAARLIEEARFSGCKHILAVVGAGHLKGIRQYLDTTGERYITEPEQCQQQLDQVPPAGNLLKLLPWLIVALILTGFAIGFSQSSNVGWGMVQQWVVINGTLAAIGALIALAHPLTIVSAFVAAPLTSLNPTISAGVVSAAVESFLRKPRVGDFSRLRDDACRIGGWWSNRVAHTFVVFFLTGLGSVVGTYIAGYKIFEAIAVV
ncbi:conjugal transfer protein TraB [Candidatus Tenderia electrophaga]|uniref:Conjugal transfer protein TraB n=1 Tax=Candidatus Tenderia electrophaga TaxID=1748243 RepID=A0A0S2TII3_9GAMM|nr:conjugal transfer protein TraB [Candidatus Tenderia electrophaga]